MDAMSLLSTPLLPLSGPRMHKPDPCMRSSTRTKTDMTGRLAVLAALLLATAAPIAAQDPTLPRVIVEGRPVSCTSAICTELVLSFIQTAPSPPPDVAVLSDIHVDQDVFCTELRQGNPQPGTCSASNPPSSPDFDPSWTGNGCGTGAFVEEIAAEIASLGSPATGFTGSLDSPLPGVSFSGACRSHDHCYSTTTMTREGCDARFRTAVHAACRSSGAQYSSSCFGLAGAFSRAVENFGLAAYNAAQIERFCASWARDMQQNGCTQ